MGSWVRASAAGAYTMNTLSHQPELVRGSKRARLATYLFIAALIISGLIFKSQPENASVLTSVGVVIAIAVLVFGACYAIYLAVGAIRTGQFPASNAHVPMDCKVVRGYRAKVYSGIMVLAAVSLGLFAILVIRIAFASG